MSGVGDKVLGISIPMCMTLNPKLPKPPNPKPELKQHPSEA